ncbi:hypothetical protein N7471_006766 [Penicillium samsonianum]|uniref:uncharacterized protein n=1 Tax=Penicillium samsonianum TaxID=1882272 RepID=UPI00254725B9|nr:uncharacterized protein N7471_006766 [Penicillium samsonianum]KAJ6140280.1 hypothetical protein N7471_006766 [Penicillium samsonianum]
MKHVVVGTYGQIQCKEASILNDEDEISFDRAFDFIRSVIQGTVEEGTGKAAPDDASEAVELCLKVIRKAQNRPE